jgi:hypothetical protein
MGNCEELFMGSQTGRNKISPTTPSLPRTHALQRLWGVSWVQISTLKPSVDASVWHQEKKEHPVEKATDLEPRSGFKLCITSVLVCSDCTKIIHRLAGVNNRNIVSQFWRLEVQVQGVCTFGFFLRLLSSAVSPTGCLCTYFPVSLCPNLLFL